MNAVLTVTLCLCALASFSSGVTVKVGDFSFSLASVKQLKNLLEEIPKAKIARMSSDVLLSVCENAMLPAEFKPLCASPRAAALLQELEPITQNPEICEACGNIACSGC
ncbi:guanylin [Elgaria multicarinata webbii]|uniref:guanylin n=1 Tax=Elgaria multicarinata webbii TaxID=159646 RepID=UPI002FCD5E7D